MASTMASTTLLSRPSEKLGTHSTSVDITGKNKGSPRAVQLDQTKNRRREITSTAFESGFQIVAYALPRILAHHQRTPTRRKRQSWKNSGSLCSKACPMNCKSQPKTKSPAASIQSG